MAHSIHLNHGKSRMYCFRDLDPYVGYLGLCCFNFYNSILNTSLLSQRPYGSKTINHWNTPSEHIFIDLPSCLSTRFINLHNTELPPDFIFFLFSLIIYVSDLFSSISRLLPCTAWCCLFMSFLSPCAGNRCCTNRIDYFIINQHSVHLQCII